MNGNKTLYAILGVIAIGTAGAGFLIKQDENNLNSLPAEQKAAIIAERKEQFRLSELDTLEGILLETPQLDINTLSSNRAYFQMETEYGIKKVTIIGDEPTSILLANAKKGSRLNIQLPYFQRGVNRGEYALDYDNYGGNNGRILALNNNPFEKLNQKN